MRPRLKLLALILSGMCGENQALLIPTVYIYIYTLEDVYESRGTVNTQADKKDDKELS